MDAHDFDRWTVAFAQRPTRRATLRLLTGGLLAALLPARAARAVDCPDGQFDCGAGCVDLAGDPLNCGVCGTACDTANGDFCAGGFCTRPAPDPDPPPPATCTAVGGACSSNTCCQTDPNYTFVQCCFDANGAGVCTDVAASGTFLCPDPGVPDTGCAVGMTNCGGFCTDLGTDHGNCGVCGQRCSQPPYGPGYNCTNGACVKACQSGMSNCGDICVDLQTHWNNCGRCGYVCVLEDGTLGNCVQGACVFPD